MIRPSYKAAFAGFIILLATQSVFSVPVNIAVPALGEGLKKLKQWTILVKAIEESGGIELNLIVARDNFVIEEGLGTKNYDLAFVDSFWYLIWEKQNLCREIASVEIGGKKHRKILLISNKDSIYRNIHDLKNKSIAFTLKNESAAGFYIPLAMLLSKGIDPFSAFKESIFSETFLSILKGTAYGKLDAGFVTTNILNRNDLGFLSSSVRVILESDSLPQWILIGRNDFDPEIQAIIETVLLNMDDTEEGRQILSDTGFTGFDHTEKEDFTAMKKYLDILEANNASPE